MHMCICCVSNVICVFYNYCAATEDNGKNSVFCLLISKLNELNDLQRTVTVHKMHTN